MMAAMAASPDDLTVYKFRAGMTIRVMQTFVDYDGQKIREGEVLHLLDTSYFPYDSGHTLKFAEKTIRLAGIDDHQQVIIENRGNAWFQLVP